VRRPRADKAVFIFKNLTANHAKYANIFLFLSRGSRISRFLDFAREWARLLP
jgi:hypothetical protein